MLSNERGTAEAQSANLTTPAVGTRRNDDRIASQAMGALEREKLLPSLRVRLSVEHGWLTLSGNAAHTVERSAAECVVRYVPGVKGVINDIVVMADTR